MSRRILKLLGESDIPCSTPEMIAILATGLSYPRSRVWVELRKLERAGLVKRAGYRRVSGVRGAHRETLWSLA